MSSVSPVIDPHIHLWDQRKTPRKGSPLVKVLGWHRPTLLRVATAVFPKEQLAYFGRGDYVLGDYLLPDYLADTSTRELRGFVHVQAGWEERGPLGSVGETRWLESLRMPALKGIVGHADLAAPDVDRVLRAHVSASPRFRGIRHMLAHHPDDGVMNFCEVANQSWDPAWRAGYARLAEHNLSFDAWAYHHQLDDVTALARDFPDVPLILCHAGTPVGYGGAFSRAGVSSAEADEIARRWRDGMSRLAEHDNVAVKLSGLVMPAVGWDFHNGDAPSVERVAEQLGPLISFVIDTFGVERCMFASNFPVDKVSLSWARLYEAFERIVGDRTDADRCALFHDNAVRIYRLDVSKTGG